MESEKPSQEDLEDLENLKKFVKRYSSLVYPKAKNIEQFILNVTDLEIVDKNFISLPDTIGKLINLTELYLENTELTLSLEETVTRLTSLSETIGNLVNLRVLVVRSHQLTALPNTIGKLTNLIKLDLGKNQITSLPETIGKLVNLTELNLDNNKLTALPETIGELTNLTILDVNYNKLTSLPETIRKLTNLRYLTVKKNKLISLPMTIGKLVNLDQLNISSNKLLYLPETIGELINLLTLVANENQLNSLPETIGKLTNLKSLFLENNQLTSLPETIGNLSLNFLDVRNNLLEELPKINATNLWIEGNPAYRYRKNREKFKEHLEKIGDKVHELKMSENNRELQKMTNEFCQTFVDNRKINEIRVMAKRLDIPNYDKKTKEELCSQIHTMIVLKSQILLPYIISAESFK
jgi:Leucine-rich repeat (LRR) protein